MHSIFDYFQRAPYYFFSSYFFTPPRLGGGAGHAAPTPEPRSRALTTGFLREVRMHLGLSSRDPLLRIVGEKLFQKVDALGANLRLSVPNVCPAARFPSWKGGLEVWERGELGPLLGRWRAQLLEDLEDRIDLGIPAEQWSASRHFRHDAA